MKVKDLYLLPISSKGQVTIPAEIRRVLDLERQKKVLLEVLENKQVILKKSKFSLEDVFGSVPPIKESFLKIRKIAREERLKKHL